MARRYGTYTPARRAALRKAQLASAAKRRGKRRIIIGAVAGVAVGSALVARHHVSGSQIAFHTGSNRSLISGKQLSSGVRGHVGRTTNITVATSAKRYSASYHHVGLHRRAILGAKTRNHVDRDSIPMYNPKAKSRSWPHVGAPQSRRINAKLREKGHIE